MWMLASLLLTVICLCGLLKKRFEEMLPPVAMTAVLVLYVLAFGQDMLWFVPISYAAAGLAAAVLIWQSIRTRGKTIAALCRNAFTPGMAAFAILTAVLYPACMKQIVIVSDDIRFWGLQAHSIWAHNGLTDAAHHLSPRFMTYTPGMQLFQWLGMYACGEWNEGVAYVMLAVFSLILIIPMAKPITWKKAWLLPLFMVFALLGHSIWIGWMYSALIIDSMLGLAFGYCLICLWKINQDTSNKHFHLICAALGMCVLTLLKQAGIAWALMVVAMMVFVLKPWKNSVLSRSEVALAGFSPLVVLGSWQWFVKVQNLGGGHYDKTLGNTAAIFNGEYSIVEAAEGLGATYIKLLLSPMVPTANVRLFAPPLILWMVALIVLPLIFGWIHKEYKRLLHGVSIWAGSSLIAFFIGYTFILVTAFLGAEKTEDGLWIVVLGCTRYITPIFLGVMLLLLYHLVYMSCAKHPCSRRLAALLAVIFVLLLPCMSWGEAVAFLDPKAEQQDTELFWEIDEVNYWRYDLDEPQNAIVLYGMMPATFNHEHLQYATAPVKLVLHDNQELDEESFANLLRDHQVTHVICIDDYNVIYEQAQNFSGDGWIDLHTLYEVSWEDGEPVLWMY